MRNKRVKKRYIIITILIIIGLFLVREEFMEGIEFSVFSPKVTENQESTFFIATDIHYLSPKLKDRGSAFKTYTDVGDGKQLDYVEYITDALIEDISKNKPQALIISGDLTNNGEKQSHLDLKAKLEQVEALGTQVYVIPGNHDIANSWARGFRGDEQYKVDTINSKDFEEIYNEFGYKQAISRDKDTLSYLVAPTDNTWLLMLDTVQYPKDDKITPPVTGGVINSETYEWIEACSKLAKKKGANIIVVMHHNIIDHNDVFNKGFTVNENQKALDKFMDYGINTVLSGHIHIQNIAKYNNENSQAKTLYDIATGSLSVYPEKYGVLKYIPQDRAYDYSTATVDVEGLSRKLGIVNEQLNNFSIYSKEEFHKQFDKMSLKYLKNSVEYSEEQKQLMLETMMLVSRRVVEGNEHVTVKEIIDSKGFELWNNSSSQFHKKYIESVIKSKDVMDNTVTIYRN